jgi:signal peptidase I
MRRGVPVIDGRPAVQESEGDVTYGSIKAARLREHFSDGTSYEIMKRGRVRQGDDGGPFTVPADSYFVLGDNRDDAVDSRHSPEGRWIFIPGAVLTGQAKYIYWSGFDRLDRIGLALK